MSTTSDIWRYRDTSISGSSLVDYRIEAIDGEVGKVDEADDGVGSSYLIVDTGPWIFGKKVMLPAGVIERVDHTREAVFVNRTKDEIKDAPEFDEDRYQDESYRNDLGGYYGPGGLGYRA